MSTGKGMRRESKTETSACRAPILSAAKARHHTRSMHKCHFYISILCRSYPVPISFLSRFYLVSIFFAPQNTPFWAIRPPKLAASFRTSFFLHPIEPACVKTFRIRRNMGSFLTATRAVRKTSKSSCESLCQRRLMQAASSLKESLEEARHERSSGWRSIAVRWRRSQPAVSDAILLVHNHRPSLLSPWKTENMAASSSITSAR